MSSVAKYRPYLSYLPVELRDRSWPDRTIEKAPIWCSVDLRDGNQALVNPMNFEQKLEMFALLVSIGFTEIEIGFPSAAKVEFDFTRALIERGLIPDEVSPQVLTQAREHLIDQTMAAISGAKKAIVHLYNSTSELQRRVVFNKDRGEILNIATEGTARIRELARDTDTEITLEYSPESFTGTELEFSREICEAVLEAWQPKCGEKVIINLPATVEMSTPNIYADQIEWFSRNIAGREKIILSLHPHNDRGSAVAATELGLMAGADRVEGTLFGNGERTGNVDLVTLALNLYTQGVDPQLKIYNINRLRSVCERLTEIPVHQRHPYVGELVFTAFSGSHQDAINKGMRARSETKNKIWEVPYLPIDPADLGRQYEPIVRINSQSGKGGVAYILHSEFGCDLPKDMHPEVSRLVQSLSDEFGREIRPAEIWELFAGEYLERSTPYGFISFSTTPVSGSDDVNCSLTAEIEGTRRTFAGIGNGPIDAARRALVSAGAPTFRILNFSEHARTAGADAEAVAFIQIEVPSGERYFGVGINPNTTTASIKAIISALNRVER